MIRNPDDLSSRAYQTAPVGLCYLDRAFRYLQINEWLARINGLPVEQHLGKTLDEVVPDVARGIVEHLVQVAESRQPILNGQVVATTPAHPDEKRTYEHNFFPDVTAVGNVVGFNVVVWDVTEHLGERKRQLLEAARGVLNLLGESGAENLGQGQPLHLPSDASLSSREREVVLTLAQISSVAAVAEKLSISENTVRNHLKAVYRKLGVSSQTELLSIVLRGAQHR